MNAKDFLIKEEVVTKDGFEEGANYVFPASQISELMEKYSKYMIDDWLVAFGIWIDSNHKFIENGNISELVNEFLNEKD